MKFCFTKKIVFALMALVLLIGVFGCAEKQTEEIVILYTNDIHTYIANEEGMSYDNIAALKESCLQKTGNVLLLDAGDHVQGTAYGAMDSGISVIELMNAAKYDAATLGNHEFDYTMSGTFAAIDTADFTYLSCNFKELKADKNLLDSYKIFEFKGVKVAVIGITTPDTLTSSAPAYFQDENGNYIYDILGGKDGKALYDAVQSSIDSAKKKGADYVIALGHLGVDPSTSPWMSTEVIANTTGLTAFIDGHSHTEMSEMVQDKDGNEVLLTQTGSYLGKVGKLTIALDGTVKNEFVSEYEGSVFSVKEKLDAWVASVDGMLGEKVAESKIHFSVNDMDGNRIVRIMSCNMGDFNADAYYYYLNKVDGVGCDIAFINGGGVRASVDAGEWSYKTAKTVNPFGNVICLMEVTGQQILDALEWGARYTTGAVGSPECGGFLHTAGLTYEIDTAIASTVVEAEDGVWKAGPTGGYRVGNVKIYNKEIGAYESLVLDKTYTIAGANYTLRDYGDGFGMFAGATLVKDYIAEDYLALAAYAEAFADSDSNGYADIASANSPLAIYKDYLIEYETLYGSGRIVIK